ncbi:hypothetical protein [Salinigranum sp. GCM10025319]|uniref:hypothetical protein n=1 Tax=Salinigranum sp. GCM10025319 TaxID=3252687 RepID=UPI003612EB03
MVSRDTLITAFFALLAVDLWQLSWRTTDNVGVQLGLLVGIGVVLPTLINEARRRRRTRSHGDD